MSAPEPALPELLEEVAALRQRVAAYEVLEAHYQTLVEQSRFCRKFLFAAI